MARGERCVLDRAAGTALKHQHDAVLCERMHLVTCSRQAWTRPSPCACSTPPQLQTSADQQPSRCNAQVQCRIHVQRSVHAPADVHQQQAAGKSGSDGGQLRQRSSLHLCASAWLPESPGDKLLGGLYQRNGANSLQGLTVRTRHVRASRPYIEPHVCALCASGQHAPGSGALACEGDACQPVDGTSEPSPASPVCSATPVVTKQTSERGSARTALLDFTKTL